ncbi:peptide methionine sulfoxide reductase MsrB-like isoform X2 [Stegodyphus dumicola]|uniref:peptide methionine sulfoxide reductase MsrB-like isoform X2 n=1 Tax=Stegodyphus dumicola TaxID=202533 RepID=UPI0015B0A849|nr:peptide methionine sulfoxide reductase MsrB-like isoform X2 [Stegodyphus dumicola]
MQFIHIYRSAFSNFTIKLVLKNVKPFHHFAGRLFSVCSISAVVQKYNIETIWLSSDFKRRFSKMECCGNGCGIDFSKEELKQRLTPQQYSVTQEKDTERPFTGKYCNHFEKGIYSCIVCNQDLFSSEAKFETKCGWPSFFDVIDSNNVKFKEDLSHDMKRTEVLCSKCGAHLGHVFDDGPKPTKKRYCINSAALDFKKAEDCSSNDVPKS